MLVLFALSGFAGLVYESIWTHYLKLILGHAAYAQSLVLAIFMGGMALGAWLISRFSGRLRNLLIAYAVIEIIIGLAALGFHPGYLWVENQLLSAWLPAIGDVQTTGIIKWVTSACLILPQSVLLGATFPLMSGALIRLYPERTGNSLSFLYFSNSIGAATGVLVSGFVLIPAVGLPGTVWFAGIVSIAVGLVAWLLGRGLVAARETRRVATPAQPTPIAWTLMGAALVTGMASFIYEIGWIRMLTLVLGTTTQSFELMLAAFIGGLALGSLWIRKRMDKIDRPLVWAANVQLLMGALALLSIVAYMHTFDLMAYLLETVRRDDLGFTFFRVGSHLIALLLMLPTTFMAGMTLPLFTYSLIRSGGGEASIGRIYSANTLGAIIGVALAVHWGLPSLGLKGLIGLGAGLDIALGVGLLLMVRKRTLRDFRWAAGFVAICCVLAYGAQFDSHRLASGVYRSDGARLPDSIEVQFHKDGSTASVDLIRAPEMGHLMLKTNGKVDASINVGGPYPSIDEYTQALLGLIPLALKPQPSQAAIIGLGSGMSTHVLLGNQALEHVYTIEIEPAMVEAARQFGPAVERAFSDPRGEIVIEDARTWFSTRKEQFDIIISEPSNPWISGIGALFTREFYAQIREHLTDDGLFVQWLHLYDIDPSLVASVIKALGHEFGDYALIQTIEGIDVALVAGKGELPRQFDPAVFTEPSLKPLLERLSLHTTNDIAVRFLGDRKLLQPYVDSFEIPMNSDFYPLLTIYAARAFFLQKNAEDFTAAALYPVPVVDLLSGRFRVEQPFVIPDGNLSSNYAYFRHEALGISAILAGRTAPDIDPEVSGMVPAWQASLMSCASGSGGDENFLVASLELAKRTTLYLTPDETRGLWSPLLEAQCDDEDSSERSAWLSLHLAAGLRDAAGLAMQAEKLLSGKASPGQAEAHAYLLIAAMTGHLASGEHEAARAAWSRWGDRAPVFEGARATLAVVHAIAFDPHSQP